MKKTNLSLLALTAVLGSALFDIPNSFGKVLTEKIEFGAFSLDEKKITEALTRLGKEAPGDGIRKAARDFQKSRGNLGIAYQNVISKFQIKAEPEPSKKSWEMWAKGGDFKTVYAEKKGGGSSGSIPKSLPTEALVPEIFFKVNNNKEVSKARKEFEQKGEALKVAISSAPPEYKSDAFKCLADYDLCLKSDFNIAVCLGYLTLCAADTLLP